MTADISYQVYEVIRYCGLSQEPYQSYPEVTKTHAELPTLAELKNLLKDAGLHVGMLVLKRMVVKIAKLAVLFELVETSKFGNSIRYFLARH